MAANADVRFGTRNPKKDLRLNTIATFNLLNEMKKNNIKNIIFSSTGSIMENQINFQQLKQHLSNSNLILWCIKTSL